MVMVMAENDILQKEVVANAGSESGSGATPKSPWNRPADKPTDSALIASKTCPALSDMQRAKSSEVSSNSPPLATDEENPAPLAVAEDSKASTGLQKSHGGGSGHSSNKHVEPRHHRGGSKRNQNGIPPFAVPIYVPYYQPVVVPHVYPPVPVPPPIPVHAYVQPSPAPFPSADNQLTKSGSQTRMQALGPLVPAMDASRNIQPPPQGDSVVNAANFSDRRPNVPEGRGHLYPGWHPQRAFGPRDSIVMQHNMAPRPYMRPAFFGPAPFVGGPPFPGSGPVYYIPTPAPGSTRAFFPSRFAPDPLNPPAPLLLPETLALRENIVKQIEYYFSDENLPTDHYLISQMDGQGWVPISIVADFKRVKKMTTDVQFILDALQVSHSVEVQGDKVRKRENWSKYVVVSPSEDKVTNDQATEMPAADIKKPTEKRMDLTTGGVTELGSGNEAKVDISSNEETLNKAHGINSNRVVEKSVGYNGRQASSGKHVASNERVVSQMSYKSSGVSVAKSLPVADNPNGAKSKRSVSQQAKGIEFLSNSGGDVDDLSNDFASTFMLDEELEMEQKKGNKDEHYRVRR